jgi:hypothetical protein
LRLSLHAREQRFPSGASLNLEREAASERTI